VSKLKTLQIPSDIERYGDCKMRCGTRTIWEFYVDCVANGTSPKMAEALAMQQAPGIGITDTNYIADQNRHGRSILDRMNGDATSVEVLRRKLKKHGYTLKSDDHYIETVARFPGDPQAIVNHTNTIGDLKRRLIQRGTPATGMLNLKGDPELAPKRKKHRLNPRLVQEIDSKNLQANPDLARTNIRERHAAIIEKHGAPPAKE
jgi:hypothetical protein